jgi:predicted outer membrane protein
MRFPILIVVVSMSLGAGACRGERDDPDVDTTTVPFDTGVAGSAGAARRDTSPPPATPDGAVLGAFIAANQHSAEFSRLAAQNASAQAVRDLGTAVASDHDDLVARAKELGQKLGMTPVPPPDGTARQQHADALAALRGQGRGAFDRAYLQHALEHHQGIQDEINSKLLLDASNAELKTFLQQSIPLYQAHVKAAQDLLAKQPSM